MSGINKCIILGRLGQDPESKQLESGMVTNFTVATSEKWTKDGQAQEKTEWHRISTFGKLAELTGQYLKKGRQVYIEGKIRTRQWDKDGETRYSTDIIADKVEFLGDAKNADTSDNTTTTTAAPYVKPTTTTPTKPLKNYAPQAAPKTDTDDIGF